MTDTNNKDTELRSEPKGETFESFSQWSLCRFARDEWFSKDLMKATSLEQHIDWLCYSIHKKFKQFHDQSLIDLKYEMKLFKWKSCQNVLQEKDKQISEYEQKLIGQVQIIKELQAEIEFQRDLLSEPCNECKKRIEGLKQ